MDQGSLVITIDISHGVGVVNLAGDVDALGAPSLRGAIEDVLDHGVERLVFDVSRVSFTDSSGLAAFVYAWKQFDEVPGAVVIRGAGHSLLRLIAITGLDAVLEGRSAS